MPVTVPPWVKHVTAPVIAGIFEGRFVESLPDVVVGLRREHRHRSHSDQCPHHAVAGRQCFTDRSGSR